MAENLPSVDSPTTDDRYFALAARLSSPRSRTPAARLLRWPRPRHTIRTLTAWLDSLSASIATPSCICSAPGNGIRISFVRNHGIESQQWLYDHESQ